MAHGFHAPAERGISASLHKLGSYDLAAPKCKLKIINSLKDQLRRIQAGFDREPVESRIAIELSSQNLSFDLRENSKRSIIEAIEATCEGTEFGLGLPREEESEQSLANTYFIREEENDTGYRIICHIRFSQIDRLIPGSVRFSKYVRTLREVIVNYVSPRPFSGRTHGGGVQIRLEDLVALCSAVADDLKKDLMINAHPDLLRERLGELKLPGQAPEAYKDTSEDAVKFLARVWGPYIEARLMNQADLERLDNDLRVALENRLYYGRKDQDEFAEALLEKLFSPKPIGAPAHTAASAGQGTISRKRERHTKKRRHPTSPAELPAKAPELYVKGAGENAVEFIMRVWGEYMRAKIISQADIKRLDPGLYVALQNWRRLNRLPPNFDLPSKEQFYDRIIDKLAHDPSYPVPPQVARKLGEVMRGRQRRGRRPNSV